MSYSITSQRYLCSVLTMALLPIIASAEVESTATDVTALDEVVVTATKQSRELSKVPISITALTQETMDERAIKDIGDIVLQTPGLDMGDQGSNGVGTRVSIRGIDSNSGFATTGIYIDDTPIQGRANPVNLGGTAFPEVFDLERVEVLRGPQGTLFGAGAEGGVVRFITPTPSLSA
ncbi:MAG: TonB-dependent receptor plug domain-containing protein, partial [Steroidobacter sp.]